MSTVSYLTCDQCGKRVTRPRLFDSLTNFNLPANAGWHKCDGLDFCSDVCLRSHDWTIPEQVVKAKGQVSAKVLREQ